MLFFTTWNYCLQIMYWALACAAGVRLLVKPHWALLESRGERLLARSVWSLFSVCLPASVMVSAILWGVLLPATIRSGNTRAVVKLLQPASWMQHLVNTLLLGVDFSVSHMLIDESTLVLMVGWIVAYVLFEWIAHSQSHFWTYFFLEIGPYTPLWYLALAIVGIGAHALVCAASRQKALQLVRAQAGSSLTASLTSPTADADANAGLSAGSAAAGEEAGGGLQPAGAVGEEDGPGDDADASDASYAAI
ncbi:hypothetical protein T492DRAFT_1093278 [Pavlovales sp. CCMP2436]|nr:hypothetical protein T492DRAFT_1093278 [Pavlovales sp. CCMP2436]